MKPSSVAAAPVGRRVGAYAIDAVVAGLISGLAMGLGAVFIVLGGNPANAVTLATGVLLAYLLTFAVSLAWALVYTAMQAGAGSIGQRLLHVALADAQTGERIGFGRALLRNIVWAASCMIIVGYFTPLFDAGEKRQGWHDKAARTVVVDLAAAPVAAAPAPSVPVPARVNPFLTTLAGQDTTDAFLSSVAAPPSAVAAPPVVLAAPPAGPANPFLAQPAGAAPLAQPAPVAASPGVTFPTVPAESPGDLTHTDPVADAPAPSAVHAPVRTPVIPVASSGVISSVPGVSAAPLASASRTPAASASIASAPAVAPVATSAFAAATELVAVPAPTGDDEDLDATRAHVASAAPASRRLALVWDDGTRSAIYARTVFGRNPAADGATAVAVRDETLSLSKTHFEVDPDADGAWITDRHSTNGTVLLRAGAANPLAPGERVRLQAGDRVEIGDRSLTVEAVA